MTSTLMIVGVRDVEVVADIGVHAHEIGRPQLLRITATLRIRVPEADQIAATIDYLRIVEAAKKLGGRHIALIETFARLLAEDCLTDPRVDEVEILVEKPQALTSGIAFARLTLAREA